MKNDPENSAPVPAESEAASEPVQAAPEPQSVQEQPVAKKGRRFGPKAILATLRRHPRRTALGAVLLLVIIFAVPFTRYQVLGLVVKKPVSLKLTDSKSGAAISEATVRIRGQEAVTDSEGVVQFSRIKVGQTKVTVSKKYYESLTFDVLVGLKALPQVERQLIAEGRPVDVRITNLINKQVLADASIVVDDSRSKTKEDGTAQLVVAPDAKEVQAEVSLEGYNTAKITIKPTDSGENANHFTLTPAGKLYFLSKASGKIDVVKTNLDGTERETVLAGTGHEDDTGTVLLASRDWRYLILKAKRDNRKDYNAVYLINTHDKDKLTTADEGDAFFDIHGWIDHQFVYTVNRNVTEQPEKYKLKTYNAEAGTITLLDKTEYRDYGYGPIKPHGHYWAERKIEQLIRSVTLLKNEIIYAKIYSGNHPADQPSQINRIIRALPDNSRRLTLNEVDTSTVGYHQIKVYEPHEIYFSVLINGTSKNQWYEYEVGGDKAEKVSAEEGDKFNNQTYSTYLDSPSGKLTFWSESRDGKGVFQVGNDKGGDGKEIARLSEHNIYGWYTDDYLLLSKNSSELYIMGRDGGEPVKITDYHKPAYDYRGYGGGYGGF